ncbi:TetR/AcrR family transcriptional regulator [Microbacterium betulae]|uniref:TetR/AcrR family transcriptional regulator n=1 Tax=Microbacterium betulae TaxID=2981139 RepID=A0AA97I5L0_9MICO|nr:TetR/AcrR family transcriptional regulator [Microbacterium sp. AB]WOF21600.1 TetR/AcrR family transcriptional regulator [Microbacterium sp. AB]
MANARAGRPRASSREVLAEAACELFLEKGFDATSIADIANRAGVSRSSFFNYASSKSGLLWAGFDERAAGLSAIAGASDASPARPGPAIRSALLAFADGFRPDALALVFANAEAMGMAEELEREAAVRLARLASTLAALARRGGADHVLADVTGVAYAGALLTSLRSWALAGPGTRALSAHLETTLAALARLPV